MIIGLSINGCLHSKTPFCREKTRLNSPEVGAAATSKASCHSSRTSFSPSNEQMNKVRKDSARTVKVVRATQSD